MRPMKWLRRAVIPLVAFGALAFASSAWATFTQCPPVGLDSGCAVLITVNPNGSTTTATDPSQPPFDGVEDTLVGVQNNQTATTVTELALTGSGSPGILQFDGDGLCSGVYFPGPSEPPCPYGATRYEGRATAGPIASEEATTFPAETFTGSGNTGAIKFVNPPIPALGSAYFSLEGPTSSFTGCTGGTPTSVTLSPLTATNNVGTSHTVTATVTDTCGEPVSGATVQFTVTRTPPPGTSGSCVTGSSGTCSFTYTGPILPAADVITGCAGPSGTAPCGTATKSWVLPPPTALCSADITQGGWMIADNSDRVNFGGVAHTDQAGAPSGEEQYTDKKALLNAHSINILSITCTAEKADIYGTATENGTGSHMFRIEVTDPDSSKSSDTYWMFLDNYNSGSHPLSGGHVEIHKT
jgi:Bacterial Ig-like domain (group 1)